MKLLAKKLLRAVGYELVTSETAREFLQAGALRELFRRFNIGLALDVGANEGQFHDFLREQVMYKGRVVSFEPIPSLAEHLSIRARRERNWEIKQLALGASRGSGQFNVAASSTLSSFLPLTEDMQHVPVVSVENVTIDTLDLLGPLLFRDIPPEQAFLKLDTQGYDLEVLKGGSQYVQRLPFLTTEVPFIKIYQNMPDFSVGFEYLRDLGFGLAGMWPTSRDRWFRVREFDCLFVNNRL